MFWWIAGPCVIESREMTMLIAEKLKEIAVKHEVLFYFKASFDKANRTSVFSERGPGLEEGLRILQEVKERLGIGICTDIHEPWQAAKAAQTADVIQIPAFLCRQTDLLKAAAETGKIVNIKKGQFLAPWDMEHVIKKVEEFGGRQILLCERGTSFGYQRLVVDMTAIPEMKKFGYPVIFDATHSVQRPGALGASTGGNREYAIDLAKAATAAGADGLFMEVHPQPEKALSDGPNSIPLDQAECMLQSVKKIHELVAGLDGRSGI